MKILIYAALLFLVIPCLACPTQDISKTPNEEKIHENSRIGKDSPRAPWPRSTVALRFFKSLNKNEITNCFGSLIHKVEKLDGDTALVLMYIADAWELSKYSIVKEINNPELLKQFSN